MYCCLAYDYNNKLLAVPCSFATEEEAWNCIAETMKQENHPKMMWVKEGVEFVGHVDSDSDSRS